MKKLYLLSLFFLLPLIVFSEEAVSIDGVCYVLISKEKIAEVTYCNYYTGSIVIPEMVTYEGVDYTVTAIQKNAFRNCNITSVDIPNTINKIEGGAFWGCSSLSSVNIKDIKSWCNIHFGSESANPLWSGHHLYLCNEEIIDLLLPGGINSVNSYAFAGASSLKSVVVPEGVSSIEYEAFFDCSALTSVTLSNDVNTIGGRAFENCSALNSINLSNSLSVIDEYAFHSCTALESVTVPNSVTAIGDGAFEDCISLSSINISNNVSSINERTFYNCKSLKSIIIPEKVTSICESAFEKCIALSELTFPTSIKNIGKKVFSACGKLAIVNISDLSSWFSIVFEEELSNPLYFADQLCVKGNVIENLVIPDDVTAINKYSFPRYDGLKSLSIPSNVLSIGEHAFSYCDNLMSINIESGLIEIGNYSFNLCKNLSTISLPNSLVSIGTGAFESCLALNEIVMPNNISQVGSRAFAGCSSLISVSISNNLKTIEKSCFEGCGSLTAVSVPYGVTKIAEYAFRNCVSLTNIVLPSSVTTIGERAFTECGALTTVTLGKGIYRIYEYAFASCKELSDVYCYADNVPLTELSVFKNSYVEYATLHVRKSLIDAYSSTNPWSTFKNIVKLDLPQYTLKYIVDGEDYKSYQLEEGEGITPEAAPTKDNYTFSGWSEIPATMPAHDVTVEGSFSINKYKLVYKVDGEEYKSYEIEYGAAITPEPAPTKEGYTFSGWSEIPETMPAHDVTVEGSYSINKYKLVYMVDGVEYKSYEVEFGTAITPEAEPTKEYYTFSGWSEIPETMPAKDVTVTGTFSINKYKLVYKVDGEEYKSYEIEYGASITPEPAPTKEGYSFSGWSEIPETMPAHDVTVEGSYSINKYKLVYKVDGEEYKSYEIEYGASITPEPAPTKEGYSFSGWSDIPETMPAKDVTITGSFSINKYKLVYKVDGEEYKSYDVEYGAAITAEPAPTKEGFEFSGWSDIPATMPAHDVTVTGTFKAIEYKVDDATYEVSDGEATIVGGENYSGDIEVPSTVVINNVTYPVTSISDGAFQNNTNITSATIPESVTTIGANAFDGCSSLSEVNLGKSVTTIGSKAFANMGSGAAARRANTRGAGGLVIKCYATNVPTTAADAFENTSISNATLLVDDNSVAAYKAASPWSSFGTIMGFSEATGINGVWIDNYKGAKIFSIDGKPLNNPQKGINIIHMDNGKTKKVLVR